MYLTLTEFVAILSLLLLFAQYIENHNKKDNRPAFPSLAVIC